MTHGGVESATPAGAVRLSGEVMSVGRASAEDGARVSGMLRVAGRRDPVAFSGADLPTCLTGCAVQVNGHWQVDAGGRRTFRVARCTAERPTDADAVVRYIHANVDGCGPVGARRVVQVLGPSCLSRLAEDPDLIRSVFDRGDAEAMAYAWRAWAATVRQVTKAHRLALRLVEAGVAETMVRRILRCFGSADVAEIVELRHPYRDRKSVV